MRARVFLLVLTTAATCVRCNSHVRLDGRPCASDDDCIAGNVCVDSVCVGSGNDGGDSVDDATVIAQLHLGATFVVDAGAVVTDFPVFVKADSRHLDASLVAPTVQNIRFVDVEAQRLVDYELVHFDPTGTSTFWLQFVTLDGPRTIAIGYGPNDMPPPLVNGWTAIGMRGVWHFDDGSTADASNTVGELTGSVTQRSGETGDAFLPGHGAVLVTQRDPDTTPFTIEIAAKPVSGSWSDKRVVTIDPATALSNLQVDWSVIGIEARRVVDAQGTTLASWTETLDDGENRLWAKVPDLGTGSVVVYEGPVDAFVEAGFQEVLDSGLTVTRWDGLSNSASYSSFDLMNGLFSSLAYSDAALATTASVIDCPSTCVTAPLNHFALLFEGWLVIPRGVYVIGTGSDDESDVLFGGSDWKVDGNLVVNDYGAHSVPSAPVVSNSFAGYGLPVRFQYRYVQYTSSSAYHAVGSPFTSVPSYTNVIPGGVFVRRQRLTPEPLVTPESPTVLGSVLRYGDDIEILVSPLFVQAQIGDVLIDGAGSAAWNNVAVVVDDLVVTLYVDGVQVGTQNLTAVLDDATALAIGDGQGDALSQTPLIDEVRFSTMARSADWARAQAKNLNGGIVTFQ